MIRRYANPGPYNARIHCSGSKSVIVSRKSVIVSLKTKDLVSVSPSFSGVCDDIVSLQQRFPWKTSCHMAVLNEGFSEIAIRTNTKKKTDRSYDENHKAQHLPGTGPLPSHPRMKTMIIPTINAMVIELTSASRPMIIVTTTASDLRL